MSQDNKAKIVYLNEKGYGFIRSDQFAKNVFFHASACREFHFSDLKVGDSVILGNVTEGERGLLVEDVMPANRI